MELSLSNENNKNLTSGVQPITDAIRLKPEGDIVWIELDLPGEKANKLSSGVMLRLRNVVNELKTSKYKAAIFVSRKSSIFIAGADIEEIKSLKTKEDAENACRMGQEIFNELEECPVITIAAIHGACVGGGCEMILACDYRLCSDDSSTKIGLPEVQLGVIPGFGGTQRLPRMVGLQASLDIILAGKTVPGAKALKIGLVDQCVPKELLEKQARKLAAEAVSKGKRTKKYHPKSVQEKFLNTLGRPLVFSGARKAVMAQTKGNYPAPLKALDVVKKTYGGNLKKGLAIEAQGFGEVAVTDVSKYLIGLFFATEAVKKTNGVKDTAVKPLDVKSVAVLGAGIMGGGIAQLAAEKDIAVRLKDVNYDAIGKGLHAAEEIFSKSVKKKRMSKYDFRRKMGLITGATDYSGFKNVDVVVEAIVEDMKIKKNVLAETQKQCKSDAVLATNTSSLSVTEMGKDLPNPQNFVGMHFFNPVHRMPLIEVIRSDKSSEVATATIYALAKRMGKIPIVVKDGPGFLVNRLLMPYLNEAVYILGDGQSVESIDKALLKFGMPMGPLRLIDEIGIDVAVKVAKILGHDLGERAEPSPLMAKLVDSKKLGKKNRSGSYLYDEKGKQLSVDPSIYASLGLPSPKNPFSDEELVHRCLFPMINEAAICLAEGIAGDAQTVDLGMIMGTGFPPFRGGLLRWADSLGAQKIVDELGLMVGKYGRRFTPSAPLRDMAKNNKMFYGK